MKVFNNKAMQQFGSEAFHLKQSTDQRPPNKLERVSKLASINQSMDHSPDTQAIEPSTIAKKLNEKTPRTNRTTDRRLVAKSLNKVKDTINNNTNRDGAGRGPDRRKLLQSLNDLAD